MEAIGVIGMIIAIVALIYLTFKGMNGFVASLAATVILIVTSGLPFWDTMVNTYAASMGKIFGSYLFMFCVASAYSELMKQSGAAESIANFFFSIFGVKASCAATVIISFLLAYSGINAFIIIFAIYPVAVPMFRKANISKNLMPAIFLYGSVVLNVVTPGSPSMLCIALSEKLGTSTFSAPIMAGIILVLAFAIGIIYFTWSAKSLRNKGEAFVASESDAALIAGSTSGKELPPLYLAILPYVVIIVLKLILAKSMSSSDSVCTSILAGTVVLAITNYKYLKGHIVKDFTAGWLSSINALLLTAALMGFASVVNISVGFQYFIDFAMTMADKMNPYLSAVVCINVFNKQDSLTVIYQMKIHGILSAQRVVPGNCICNLTVCFDGLFVQSPTGCFNKQRNRAVNDRNQTGNNNIFAAQCNGCVEFNVLLGVIIMSL